MNQNVSRFSGATKRIRQYYHAIELTSGALIAAPGVLILSGQLTIITRLLQPCRPAF